MSFASWFTHGERIVASCPIERSLEDVYLSLVGADS